MRLADSEKKSDATADTVLRKWLGGHEDGSIYALETLQHNILCIQGRGEVGGWIHMANAVCAKIDIFSTIAPRYRLANSERRRGSTGADLFVCNLGSNSLWHLSLMFYCKLERQFRFIASCLWLTHQLFL